MAFRRRFRPYQDPGLSSDIDAGAPSTRGGGGQSGGSSFDSGSRRSQSDRDGYGYAGKPLGVPEGWTVTSARDPESFRGMSPNAIEQWTKRNAGPGSLHERGPRYFEGDQKRPAGEGRDSIIARQRALILGGYLDAEDMRFGSWDPATEDAYKRLLEEANMAGVTAQEMLVRSAEGVGMGAGGQWTIDPETGEMVFAEASFVPPPLEISTTNPIDLERVFEGAVRNQLGQGWSPDKIKELVRAYNWMEIKVQKDAYDQEVARMQQEFDMGIQGGVGLGGQQPAQQQITEVSAPTPENFLLTKLKEENPEELEDYSGMNMLMGAIDSWLGG